MNAQVSIDPQIMHGVPCIVGTRIPVYIILEKLEGGYSLGKILESYPQLTDEQVKAAIRYAVVAMSKPTL